MVEIYWATNKNYASMCGASEWNNYYSEGKKLDDKFLIRYQKE